MSAWAERLDRVPGPVAVAVASLCFVGLSLVAMAGEGATVDETAHLGSGYSYLKTGDFRMNQEHPVLVKLLAGLPLLAMGASVPSDPGLWQDALQWDYGFALLYESGNDPRRLLFWGRFPQLLWGVTILATVYAAARDLYGRRRALIALGLAAFCPTLLAHGHLVTTDVAVGAFYVLTLYAFHKLLEKPSAGRVLATGLALGGAFASKYNAVLLLPILGAVGLSAIIANRRAVREAPRRAWAAWAARGVAVIALSLGVVWATYGFRYSASPDGSWSFGPRTEGLTALVGRLRLLPEAYLAGIDHLAEHMRTGHSSYVLGETGQFGWWWYFPFAFLVKTPFPSLLLFGYGVVDALRRWRGSAGREAFLLLPILAYGLVTLTSKVNLGVRHLIPILPFLMILAAGIRIPETNPWAVWRGRLAFLGVPVTALSTLLAAPHFLGYFNEPSRLLWEKHEMFIGSSLDWGQELNRLKTYLDANGIRRVKLAYFGTASPKAAGLEGECIPVGSLYERREDWPQVRSLERGDLVVVSATVLMGRRNEWVDPLRGQQPIATVGSGLFVFWVERGR